LAGRRTGSPTQLNEVASQLTDDLDEFWYAKGGRDAVVVKLSVSQRALERDIPARF
jgi:hypothetical protein